MNIYRKLGARPTSLTGSSNPPCVYEDGSAGEETKLWALQKLGFVNGDDISYRSWCEAGDKTAIVPLLAERKERRIYLHPVPEQPGTFYAESFRVHAEPYLLGPYKPQDIKQAFDDCMKLSQMAFEQMKSQYITCINPHRDNRFEWVDRVDNSPHGWRCNGEWVRLISTAFPCLSKKCQEIGFYEKLEGSEGLME